MCTKTFVPSSEQCYLLSKSILLKGIFGAKYYYHYYLVYIFALLLNPITTCEKQSLCHKTYIIIISANKLTITNMTKKIKKLQINMTFLINLQYDSEDTLYELLKNLRSQIGMSALTLKSQHLLTLPQHERHSFLEVHKGTPLVRKNIVTCLSTLRKSHNDDDALACLVIGTENCEIFVLHPETFTPIDEV